MTPSTVAVRPLYVVPHTHWDREWYRPFESYRFRLIDTLDRVLGASLPFFLLDGQTAVLEDYLAIRPEMAEALRTKAQAGKVGVGPWYVLVDEFLVSGESLVRNLLEGRRAMRALGVTDAVGYLPDMFGHVAQMPQVLRGFGLDKAVVWRGAVPGAARFRWRSPDGSEVRAAWLPNGYYQTLFMEELTPEQRLAQLKTYTEAFGPGEPVLLLSGADHMAPRLDLPNLLQAASTELGGLEAKICSLTTALEGPPPTAELEGELRTPHKLAYILPGVLSARSYLKQANAEGQLLLERYVEPLTALAWVAGKPYQGAFVRHAWKELMKNHPHDSICGCSIDQVHREMMPRFAAVSQVGEELISRAVGVHARPVEAPGVFAFNPTGWGFAGWVDVTIDWPLASAPEAIALVGADGAEVPLATLMVEDTEVFCAEIDFNPDWHKVRRFRLAAQLRLPSFGGVTLAARAQAASPVATAVAGSDQAIENALFALRVENGTLVLTDRRTGQLYADCHYFLDEGDAGDEYNFSPLADDRPIRSRLTGSRLVESSPHRQTLEVSYLLELPEALSGDRQARSAQTRPLEIRSRFTLRADARAVEVETHFAHAHHDHRLRVVTTLGTGEQPAVWAEGPFGVFARALPEPTALPVPKGTEAVMPEFPQGLFTALEQGDRALAFAGIGLHEASLLDTPAGWALATTLVRAVGWLSRDDLRTRGGGAGPRFETPEAQCPGSQTFRYALVPYQGSYPEILPVVHQFASPPRVWQAEGLPEGGVGLSDARLVISAIKRAESGEGVIVRAYNPTPTPIEATLVVGFAHRAVRATDLQEQPGERLGCGLVASAFRPYEIKSWLVEV